MSAYTEHSKFSYINYDEIQVRINSGELNAYDTVYTKDTHENIIIAPDLTPISIKSKIYRFLDTQTAEQELNNASDTYEGQIVSIVYQGRYVAYIVNKNSFGRYYVTPLNTYDGEVDYDSLQHRPIINLEGSIGNPVVVDVQNDGIYKIIGQYKISDYLETVFSSASSNLFLVEHDEEETHVKVISARDITDYVIDGEGNVFSSIVPTTDWLNAQGYVTEGYIDAKIAALDFINKADVEEYVSNVVLQTIDVLVDQKIEAAMNEKIQVATERETLEKFMEIFK